MAVIDAIKEIMHAVESLENDLISQDVTKAKAAGNRYLQLVDRFYEVNHAIMAPQQYEAAKTDFEYFLRLLVLAISYWQEDIQETDSKGNLH